MTSKDVQQPLFICYSRCSTCAKARAWLQEHKINFIERDIKEHRPTYDELQKWLTISGLPVKRFFNTSGQAYRKLEVNQRPDSLITTEAIHLLATDGMLVKRPILVDSQQVLVGFRLDDWEQYLASKIVKD